MRAPARTASHVLRELGSVIINRRYTNAEVAGMIKMSPPTISNWLHGKSEPGIVMVEALADALGYEIILRRKA